jgi:predicted MFS family arabinose efflux permease
VLVGNTAAIGGRVAMPLFAVSLSASPMTVGIILACTSIVPVLFSILIGRWVDRIGARIPMQIATAGVVAALAIPWLIPSLWALAACAALLGICMAMIFISTQHAAGAMSRASTRMRIFTAITVGQSVPVLLGPPIAGFLIDGLGYQAAFLGLALIALTLAIMLFLARSILPDVSHPPAKAERKLLELLRHPGVRTALIISSLSPLGWEMLFFFVPVHGTRIGLSASTIGLVFSCFSVSLIGVRVAVPWLSRLANEWVLIAVSFGIAAGIFLFFSFANSAGTMMALTIVLGACHGINVPITLGIVHATSPANRRAEVLGIRSTVLNSVAVAAPLFLGALTTSIGLGAAALPLAVMLMAGSRFAFTRQNKPVAQSAE